MQKLIRHLTLALLLLGSAASSAVDPLPLQTSLESKIKSILKEVDPDAVVIINFETARQSATLPGTPFTYESLTIEGPRAQDSFSKAEVLILSHQKNIPDDVTALIKKLVSPWTKTVKLTISMLPLGAQGSSAATSSQEIEGKPSQASLGKTLDYINRLFTEGASPFQMKENLYLGFLILVGASVSLLVCVAALSWLFYRSEKTRTSTLTNAASRIASSLESSSAGQARAQDPIKAPSASSTHTGPVHHRPERVKLDLPLGGVSALLADCYWTGQDGYAYYLWRKLPSESRQSLMKMMPFVSEYATYFSATPEVDLQLEHDPYYLQPLEISHLDSKALSAHVRRDPQLFYRLPRLRLDSLNLTTREQMNIATQMASLRGSRSALPDFAAEPSSPLRELPSAVPITVHSMEDEEDLLQMGDMSLEIMTSVTSLIWATKVSKQGLEELLRKFTAQELSQAWVAPPSVLEQLSAAVPPKKRDLIQSYAAKVPPLRGSPSYVRLHSEVILMIKSEAALNQNSSSPHDADITIQAA